MPSLQFQPTSSQPTPSFWSALTAFKLDKLKLDDTQQTLTGYIELGREVVDREASTADGSESSGLIGVDGTLGVGGGSFGGEGERAPVGSIPVIGTFKNFNTIEEFRATETKKELFNSVVDSMLASFETDSPTFNSFLLVTFADLKKYIYHYWFAFPALVAKPAWEVEASGWVKAPEEMISEISNPKDGNIPDDSIGYLVQGVAGQRQAAPINQAKTFFCDVPPEQLYLVFKDPSSLPQNPGWSLRNILYYLSHYQNISRVNVICLRQGNASRMGTVYLPSSTSVGDGLPQQVQAQAGSSTEKPSAVGWERAKNGKLASRVTDLGPMMDPTKLADQAVDLNLKLMRWRIMPSLDLDTISSTKCLLLGAGTLGCYVARALLGWGIRNITFVDSATVSFSNPVRQPLFDFEECLDGGKPKAQCAADRLKKIFPGVNARAHAFQIPMPGHPIPQNNETSVQSDITKLEELIDQHDAIFLLMDSRESRWLPTVIGSSKGKIVINAALGFDSYLVMRHGGPIAPSIPSASLFTPAIAAISPIGDVQAENRGQGKKRLGCYYCNDVVAPADSLTDRTLDQMCTVTRPGIAPIAAASAVELLVSLVQHPLGVDAPAENSSSQSDTTSGSPLGLVPHQLRGQLSQWKTLLVEGEAYDRCTGCSKYVIDAYKEQGFTFLLRVFNETDYLEKVTGLDKLHAESEAMMEGMDWDEGSGSGSGDDDDF